MSILNVNQIQPVGGGNTITVTASDVSASGATITASSFVGNITGNVTSSSTSEFSSGLNVTGGSVGIGTANPTGKLELSANNSGAVQNNVIRFTDTDASFQSGQSPGRIEWNTSDADSPGVTAYIDTYGYTNAVSDLVFGTGAGGSATERLRIRYDGNIGIGTDNPISNLQVFGTNGIRVTNSANQNATTLLNFESNHPAFRMLNTSGDTTVKFKSDGDSFITSGNLGIGSDSPASTLDVAGTGQFKNNGATVKIESVPGNNFTQVQLKNDGGSFYVGRENNAGNWFATGAEYASVLRSDGSYPEIFRVNGANRFRINPNGDIGIANTAPSNWGSGAPTVEIKGNSSSQSTRGGFLGFESYSGTDGYGGVWLDNDQLKFYIGESRYTGDSSYVTPQERLRIAYADYPYIGISTNGTFQDQRLPLSIHGRGFGHGWTQQGTTQDAIYLTAGASGNYSTLTLTVNKVSWGSVAYEIHAAAYSGRHLHRIGGFYQNGGSITGDQGTTTKDGSASFAISAPASQQFTMTISGGTWTHPSAWVRLAHSGSGYLRSDLITFSWS